MALMDDGWEERMGARAAARRVIAEAERRAAEAAAWQREVENEEAGPVGMTLGDAVRWLKQEPFGCACVGGAWCCFRRTAQAKRLQRGAHIMARLLVDASNR